MRPPTVADPACDVAHPQSADRLRPILFCLIGGAAAAAHFAGTVVCVIALRWPPMLANCIGYAAGLATSYGGQSRITFRRSRGHGEPVGRFVVSSLSGFALNSALFSAMLHWTLLDYRLALAIALLITAIVTFIILDRWVFAPDEVAAR